MSGIQADAMDSGSSESRVLLRRLRSGDEDAYRVLFERYAGRLEHRMSLALGPRLRRRLGSDDLLQEVWTQFTRHATSLEYRGNGSLYRWLCRVSDNVVRMAQRAHLGSDRRALGRERSFQSDELGRGPEARLPAAEDPTPSAVASGREQMQALSRLLERLSDDHRAVIQLVYVERRPIAEAAEQLGRSSNAVKKLLGRAMARCSEIAATESFAAYRSGVRRRI